MVPRGTDDPIRHLLDGGRTEPELAAEWGLKTDTSVRKLRMFNHVPRYTTAIRMAETFGWSSAGEVMDFWSARVEALRKAS